MTREICKMFAVYIGNEQLSVYATPDAAFVIGGFQGPTTVRVKVNRPFSTVVARPRSKHIKLDIEETGFSFVLEEPSHLCFEIDENLSYPLIFLSDVQLPPDMQQKNAFVFRAGHHEISDYNVPNGAIVYLHPGAWLHGNIRLEQRKNITIVGLGVIDGEMEDGSSLSPLVLDECENIVIDGPLLISKGTWACVIRRSRKISVRHLKVISSQPCSDGIDVDGSSEVTASDCFLKCNDDCLVVKTTPLAKGHRVENVLFERCVLWNGPVGNGIEIGYETQTDLISDITFRKIDILHVLNHAESGWVDRLAALAIHLTHDALVQNILFEDIVVEDVQTPKIIQFITFHYYRDHGWFSPPDRLARGRIRNLHLRNVQFLKVASPRVHLEGFNSPSDIEGVQFEGVTIEGISAKEYPGFIFECVNSEDVKWI